MVFSHVTSAMARPGAVLLLLLPALLAFTGPRPHTPPRRVALRAKDDAVGVAGIGASLVMTWSELTLKTTGCGLPAGPFGLLGATEGISYLTVLGLLAFQLYRLGTGEQEKQGTLVQARESP